MKPDKVTTHPSSEGRRSKLGEILVEQGAITVSQLEHALAEQATLKLPLGQILLKLDYVSDETMRQALGLQLNVPYLDLENVMIDRSLARVINATFAKRHALLPVATVGRTLTVAMDDPTATAIVQDLNRLTGFSVTVVTSSSRAIQRAFRRLYDDVPDSAETGREDPDRPARTQMVGARVENEPMVGHQADVALTEIVRDALAREATDLHLETTKTGVLVRMRIGGDLLRVEMGPLQDRLNQQAQELAARIRILSGTDAIDRTRPQRGRVQLCMDGSGKGAPVELRVSMIPAHGGESFAIRLLDRTRAPRTLAAMGLAPALVEGVTALLSRRAGVLLVSGPATARAAELLHACLLLVRDNAHVVTAEDPIAFVNDALTQTDVGSTLGATMAGHLRALLQHNADVIMVSDLTDRETAQLAFRAAQAGRLTIGGFAAGNDAVDVIACLRDLGVAGSALSQSLIGVLHQHGPTAVELWTPDEQDARAILQQAPIGDVRESARRTTIAMS
jgi:type IV pilus assembly protein PilB